MEMDKLYFKVTSIYKDDKLIDVKEDSFFSFYRQKSKYEKQGDKEVYKDYFLSERKAKQFIKDIKYGFDDED